MGPAAMVHIGGRAFQSRLAMDGMHDGGRGSAPLVNMGVRICIGCGSAHMSIGDRAMRCLSCGAEYGRADMPAMRFRPGDLVRIVDADAGDGASGGDGEWDTVYTVGRISQAGDGAVSYVLSSDGDPIMICYSEGPESRLERVGRKWGQAAQGGIAEGA